MQGQPDAVMNAEIKKAVDELANALQIVALLSTQLRRELGASAQQAIDLESAADNAVRAIKRLQPRSERDR